MDTLTIALCDDDGLFRATLAEEVTRCFAGHGISAETTEFSGAGALLSRLERESFDLIFLDIDMPETDGIALGHRLREMDCRADIFYVSNLDERVYEIFPVHPWSFLRKSRFSQELPGVIGEYVQMLRRRTSTVVLHGAEGQIRSFAPEEILYAEAAGKLQKLYMSREEPFFVRCALHELEEQLLPFGFIRVHKGFLVNYRCIRKITSRSVTLDTGGELPVGRDRLKQARESYLALMKWKGLSPGKENAP